MSMYSYDLNKPDTQKVTYSVRKINKGIGYGFTVIKDTNVIESFMTITECKSFIELDRAGIIDKNYNEILPKL